MPRGRVDRRADNRRFAGIDPRGTTSRNAPAAPCASGLRVPPASIGTPWRPASRVPVPLARRNGDNSVRGAAFPTRIRLLRARFRSGVHLLSRRP
jgi:hypothetical protein